MVALDTMYHAPIVAVVVKRAIIRLDKFKRAKISDEVRERNAKMLKEATKRLVDTYKVLIDEYLAAPHGEKGAVLRREGLYQSQMREWAQARETAGATRNSRKALRVITANDSVAAREVAQLTRENARLSKQLMRTEAALEIMGKLHGLLESISERPGTAPRSSKP